jgi:uncharacterized membrane protein
MTSVATTISAVTSEVASISERHGEDFYLANFRILANVLFALCMFSSVLKIEFAQDLPDEKILPYILQSLDAFANFVVAFTFLAMYWIKFIGKLHHLVRSDTRLLIIWLLYMGILCIYPFGENLIGNYPGSAPAQVTFSAIWASIGIVGFLSWWYAYRAKLIDPELKEETARRLLWESFPEPVAALISIPFAFYTDVGYYAALLLVIPANVFIARQFRDED